MNTFVYNPNAENTSAPNTYGLVTNLKYAKFGDWLIPNMGNAPERTPEENLERRRKSYQNYATSMKSQKNSYKSRIGAMNNNNVVNNNDENAWTVNTNTNEWRVEVGNNNSVEHVPRNLRYNKTWRKKTRKAQHRSRKGRRMGRRALTRRRV
jgi:hypothetical protein